MKELSELEDGHGLDENTTFKTSEAVGHKTAKEAISRAVDKHKDAMSAVYGMPRSSRMSGAER